MTRNHLTLPSDSLLILFTAYSYEPELPVICDSSLHGVNVHVSSTLVLHRFCTSSPSLLPPTTALSHSSVHHFHRLERAHDSYRLCFGCTAADAINSAFIFMWNFRPWQLTNLLRDVLLLCVHFVIWLYYKVRNCATDLAIFSPIAAAWGIGKWRRGAVAKWFCLENHGIMMKIAA